MPSMQLCCGVGAAIAATVFVAGARADITSTFDATTEGWTLSNGGDTLTWHAAQGNPAGAISGNESQSNRLWYYTAPAAYQGDLTAYLGGSVTWDLRGTTNGAASGESSDVILEGPAGRIGFSIPGNIDTASWQTFSVPLTSTGWFIAPAFPTTASTGSSVTPALFSAVLTNITGFYIQGEYRDGNDTSFLDNVHVQAPSPGAATLLGLGALAAVRRRR